MIGFVVGSLGAFLLFTFVAEKADEAIRRECVSTMYEIAEQLESLHETFGSYETGFKMLRLTTRGGCGVIQKTSHFPELTPTFDREKYRFYFYDRSKRVILGKVETGDIAFLEKP